MSAVSVPLVTCASCGAPLDGRAIEGFCRRCLAEAAFGNSSDIALPQESSPGTTRLGDYELLNEIGRGGMGVVWRARQVSLNRLVALKVIKQGPFADAAEIARFRREAAAAAALSHPNIVAIHDIGAADGHHFFSMDLIEGPTLAELTREHPLPPERAATFAMTVAEAIAAAHARGILHRDLKPANVIINAGDQPCITDFGLARRLEPANEAVTGSIAGSPGYMPPEQADPQHGSLAVTSDVYSLGALLYHLVTGRPPFQGESVSSVLLQIQNSEPVGPRLLNPNVPRDLETICLKCLEKEPSRRYATAQELADELGRFLRHEPIRARPLNPISRLWRACRRHPTVATLSAGVLLLLITTAVISTVAAWRVNRARHAERVARERAETANRSLRDAVGLLELARAEDLFAAGDSSAAVAHLAAILRRDPSNHIAVNRLVSALMHRNWAFPSAPPMRHAGSVAFVQFSPDGQQVLTLSHDKAARLFTASAGLPIATARHGDRIYSARYSPDGTRFVTASADGVAQIWNSTNGAALTLPLRHEGKVHFAEFSQDGRFVVTASADRTAGIWDAASGTLKRKLRGHTSELLFARFGPDSHRVVTGGATGSIRMWDAESGEMLFRVEDRRRVLTTLAFSPDGRRLVVACDDGIARLWDPDTRESIGEPLTHKDAIVSAMFGPNNRLLVTASKDATAHLWNAENSRPVGEPLLHEGTLTHGEFSADGKLVVTTSMDNSARIWDVATGKLICQPLRQREGMLHASFSPDGQRLVTASDDWFVQVWDIQSRGSRGREFESRLGVTSVSFAPNGDSVLATFLDRTAHVWDAGTGKLLLEPMHHAASVRFGEFSSDGRRVVTATEDGAAHVWDLSTGESITMRLRHTKTNRMARFSPDGRFVLTASEDKTARLWDAQTGQCVVTLLHSNHVKWSDFSPDGKRIVTASTDNTAGIWDARTGKLLAPRLQHARIVAKAAFSPDGRRVATASLDCTARIWDANTGEALTPPLKHGSPVIHLSFSPDGRRIMTGCWDRSVRLWDSTTGRPLTEWLEAEAWISSVCFDATGQRIATAAKGVRVWDVPPAPMPVPVWFVEFAEAVAGICLSERGNVELVARDRLAEIQRQLALKSTGDFYERLTKWFLAEPQERAASPF